MIATNHALTGALIGLTVHNPALALPAAFLSHLVCDAIPHYSPAEDWTGTKRFVRYLFLDATGCGLLVLLLFWLKVPYWPLASLCAFVAASPDFLWLRKFILVRKGMSFHRNFIEKVFGWVQWFQKPIGAYVELAWFVGAGILLWQFL